MLGFLQIGIPELGVEDKKLELHESVSFYRLTMSSSVLLEKLVLQTSRRTAQKKSTIVIDEAPSCFLKSPKQVAESGFQISLKPKRPRSVFR